MESSYDNKKVYIGTKLNAFFESIFICTCNKCLEKYIHILGHFHGLPFWPLSK